MIRGSVRNLEARVRIRVVGPTGKEVEVDAIIDTGYTGILSLPPAAVQSLELQWMSTARGILADGAEAVFDRYRAELDWNRSRMDVLIDEADADALIGMTLLNGHELRVQVRPGGEVVIRRLPTR